ncbi:MAG TPA: RIP metalloprotease RseP [Syntrophomonadaceae bacterium]|nr:RIP metalloprotease RseP [Syntrophomonadaceae bacterium]
MSVLITLIVIAVLVLAHEWGHFMAARKIGIPVYEFSLGFGYKVWSTVKNGVQYSLRIVPIGGFVRMAGEEPEDQDNPGGFAKRTPLEKSIVSLAGPFMNFFLAFLIFIVCYAVIGIPESTNQPVIGKVMAGKPAAQAGLQAGDRIISINGEQLTTWEDIDRFTGAEQPQSLQFQVERQGKQLSFSITPDKLDLSGKMGIGVINSFVNHRFGILESLKIGLQQTYQWTILLLSSLGIILKGGATMSDLAGPVGITRMVGEFAQIGLVSLLNFAAFLSINLGIMNLLPIPALDGSKIVFAVVETVRRKPMDPDREGFLNWLGFLFLMLVMVVITYNDIVKLFKG